jgi:hypothetical protein
MKSVMMMIVRIIAIETIIFLCWPLVSAYVAQSYAAAHGCALDGVTQFPCVFAGRDQGGSLRDMYANILYMGANGKMMAVVLFAWLFVELAMEDRRPETPK